MTICRLLRALHAALSSWIGSVNAFLVVSMGLLAGRLHDRGYLCVHLYFAVPITSHDEQLLPHVRGVSHNLLFFIHAISGPAKSFLPSE